MIPPHSNLRSLVGVSNRGNRDCWLWQGPGTVCSLRPPAAMFVCPACATEDTVLFQCPSCDFCRCWACWQLQLQVGVSPGGGLGGLGCALGQAAVPSRYLYRPLECVQLVVLLIGSRALHRSSGRSPSKHRWRLLGVLMWQLANLYHLMDLKPTAEKP